MTVDNLQIITTDRLLLREYKPSVSIHLFTTSNDSEIVKFLGLKSSDELESEKWRFNNGLTTFNRTFHYFHLILKETEKVIGWCGFHTVYTNHNRAELGYMLYDESDKNKGYMKEALPFILRFGFENMHLHRIEAFIAEFNIPSYKLLAANNFKKEGVLREHYFYKENYEDSHLFSLLKSEFK